MKKRDKYIYPAIFTCEEGYEIAVTFPDLPGCATSGEDEAEALAMAKDALVDVYMPAIRLSQEGKAVTRSVTLPAWLNAAALEKGINFSQALQSTLMNELGIHR
jgi:predicted RNase H-like HicB family nuclease